MSPLKSPGCPDEEVIEALGDRARKIRIVLTDVDGVLTSSHLFYGHEGVNLRAFSTRDGAGMNWLNQSGIPVGFISALDAPATRQRALDLRVEEVHLGSGDKLPVLKEICERRRLSFEQVAYLGDDLHDWPLLGRVGLAVCPQDAASELHKICHWCVPLRGGDGVFRAVSELVLKSQGHWASIVERYSG